MIKVLIVDDSLSAQNILRHIFSQDPEIHIVGMCTNGEEAIEVINRTKPDVVNLDIHMPIMDGLSLTRYLMEKNPLPIVLCSISFEPKDVGKAFQCLEAGALAALEKPVDIMAPNFKQLAQKLVSTVKLVAGLKVVRRFRRLAKIVEAPPEKLPSSKVKLVVIGASTGGPPVLYEILENLSENVVAPILIVQHIASGFLPGLVDWLQKATHRKIQLAEEGVLIQPQNVYLAPDDRHLEVTKEWRLKLSKAPLVNSVRPSVSHLFDSVGQTFRGKDVVAVLLTGMGRDGAKELKILKEKGALTFVQSRETCVVFGMPGEAVKIGAACLELSPAQIVSALNCAH